MKQIKAKVPKFAYSITVNVSLTYKGMYGTCILFINKKINTKGPVYRDMGII